MRKYLWNCKQPRLAYEILQLPLEKAGLNFPDVALQADTLKIAWVKRLLQDDQLDLLPLVKRSIPQAEKYIWLANLHEKDVPLIVKRDNFWSDVLAAWCRYNFKEPLNCKEIMNQTVWYNSFIRKNTKPFFNYRLFSCNIQYINDIIDHDGNIKSLQQLQLPHINPKLVLEFNQLIASIPPKWKQVLKKENHETHDQFLNSPESNLSLICKQTKVPCFVYGQVISKSNTRQRAQGHRTYEVGTLLRDNKF